MDEQFLRAAIEFFTEEYQMVVAIEEMAELTQALSKHIIDHPNKKRESVVEEIADVENILDQLKLIFDIDGQEISRYKIEKLERIKKRIDSRYLLCKSCHEAVKQDENGKWVHVYSSPLHTASPKKEY